ncbi:MAG TPA: ComEC/Rec2 family competence protein, partial [Nitrolancea sp.]|nr:ComEC/Rec2 family competence protein [Nitrolancea sp.]
MTTGLVLPLAWLFGVLLRDAGAGWLVVAGLAVLAGLAALLSRRRVQRVVILLLLCLSLAGFWRAQVSPPAPATLPSRSPMTLRAEVAGRPLPVSGRVHARLRPLDSPSAIDANLPALPGVHQGDIVLVRGGLSPGQPATLFVTSFEVEGSLASRPLRLRNRLGDSLRAAILGHIPEPAGSLTLGVVTGDESGMTGATRQAFRQAGLSHITAVSGWNLALVAAALALLIRGSRLPRLTRLGLLLGGIWLYAFLVGLDASVVRAAAMSSLFLLARWRGRPADIIAALLWGITAVLAVWPALRFDTGFQLSVAATVALALIAPKLVGRPPWQVALAVPAAAELAVAPLTLHHFGSFALLSPLSNFLVEALIGPVMAGGVLVALASWWLPLLADLLGAV